MITIVYPACCLPVFPSCFTIISIFPVYTASCLFFPIVSFLVYVTIVYYFLITGPSSRAPRPRGCVWLFLKAREGNTYFTELVEYGNYVDYPDLVCSIIATLSLYYNVLLLLLLCIIIYYVLDMY